MIEEVAHLGLIDDEEIEVDLAALELAALDHPDIDLDPYLDILDAIASKVEGAGQAAVTAASKAEALSSVIAVAEGFTGDRDNYDSPANADLIEVLDRRLGLPVSLAILYVATARRQGWSAHALNTPGHVLVRVGPEQDPIIIDPFNDGATVDSHQLVQLLARILGDRATVASEHITAMSNRMLLVRLLTNQAIRAEGGKQPRRALALYQRITTIAPSHAHGWWEQARTELGLGMVTEARDSLAAMLEVTRDTQMRLHISAALDALGTRDR